jgi:hypothetical protein
VIRLALDVHDPQQRARVEAMFETAYRVKRALQRDARDRCRAYWAAPHERAADPAATRARLGLSRDALEDAAFAHLDAAPHLRRFVTKALAQSLADSVWSGAERHLFRDARGQRHGAPRIGRWHHFTRIPGRARSHTKANKWETFRLHGSLAGHRAAYTNAAGDFVQPPSLRPVLAASWWNYEGPLAVVFSGLGVGTLVLPVRLPTAPSNQAHLEHHLGDPSRWHRIDLVRSPAPSAPGGWRYEAHLLVLTQPYVSPRTAERRATVAIDAMDRSAGLDVNVSNITIASHALGTGIQLTRLERDATQLQRDRGRRRRERRRQRELDRSRRAANRAQYQLSKRQEKRARRRAEAGMRPVDVIPMGPRVARTDGVPLQRYRGDTLSSRYRRLRRAHAADAHAETQRRRDRARSVAADVVATHGYQLVIEDVSLSPWARSWGRALAAFSPGLLVQAIDREARAVAARAGAEGGLQRASTRTTALSQHCACGARVEKWLADRVHTCDVCKLRGDRDAMAAVLASFVVFARHDEPSTAHVDYGASRAALPEIRRTLHSTISTFDGWQDTLSESTDLSARDGSFIAWSTSTPDTWGTLPGAAVARRTVGMASCSTLNEIGDSRPTSDRARLRTNMSRRYSPLDQLRDIS